MSKFWPKRSDPEGFSIEKLAKDSRERLARSSEFSQRRINSLDQNRRIQNHSELIIKTYQLEINSQSNFSHWANRDFDEYKTAA